MTTLLNFVAGGGLLALVQAVLAFLNTRQAKRSGAIEATAAAQAKVISDVEKSQAIDGAVAGSNGDSVTGQLREFQRD